jgi:shikimate kinase
VFRNLVLVGFMGSGKSSVGRILSSLTGFALVDTDALVAREAGQSIPVIFKEQGEEHFRALETKVLQGLVGRIGLIVATGGGIITSGQNRELLPQIGPVVWLDASPEHLYQRVKHSNRPLLQTADPRRTVFVTAQALAAELAAPRPPVLLCVRSAGAEGLAGYAATPRIAAHASTWNWLK